MATAIIEHQSIPTASSLMVVKHHEHRCEALLTCGNVPSSTGTGTGGARVVESHAATPGSTPMRPLSARRAATSGPSSCSRRPTMAWSGNEQKGAMRQVSETTQGPGHEFCMVAHEQAGHRSGQKAAERASLSPSQARSTPEQPSLGCCSACTRRPWRGRAPLGSRP